MPIAKNKLIAVSTSTPAPMRDLTTTGTIDSVTAPTSQNQLTATPPTHWRLSRFNSRRISPVEARGFGLTFNPGAPTPLAGMNSEAIQQPTPTTASCRTIVHAARPSAAAKPPATRPQMIAAKVAPSTSAFPETSSSRSRRSGRMPYLIGPNSAAIQPRPNSER